MIALWNEIIEQSSNKIALTSKRSQHLNAAFKQFFNSDLSEWEKFCCKIASSKFLMGDIKVFKANLDWSIRFETIQRILEGGYSFGDRVVSYKPRFALVHLKRDEICLTTETNAELITQIKHESLEATTLRQRIHHIVGEAAYRSWFLKTEICFEDNETGQGKAILYTASAFVRDRIRTQFRDIIEIHFDDIRVGKPCEQKKKIEETCIQIERGKAPTALISEEYLLETTLGCQIGINTYKQETIDYVRAESIEEKINGEDVIEVYPTEHEDTSKNTNVKHIIEEDICVKLFKKNNITHREEFNVRSTCVKQPLNRPSLSFLFSIFDDTDVHEWGKNKNFVTSTASSAEKSSEAARTLDFSGKSPRKPFSKSAANIRLLAPAGTVLTSITYSHSVPKRLALLYDTDTWLEKKTRVIESCKWQSNNAPGSSGASLKKAE